MKKLVVIAPPILICTLLLGTLAFAHGGMEHVLGTVTAVSDHSLSVKTRDGSVKTNEFDGQTKFTKAMPQPPSRTFKWEAGWQSMPTTTTTPFMPRK